MNYFLTEASGNTFVLFDCLHMSSTLDPDFIQYARQCLEDENRDDVLILTEGKWEGEEYIAKMLVLGLDGTFGEFCGNGTRSCASYLYSKYPTAKSFYLKTQFGLHQLNKHDDETYSVVLPSAKSERNPQFISDEDTFLLDNNLRYMEMIEPHVVVEGRMTDEELFSFGRSLNERKDIFPKGINVNAWFKVGDNSIFVKTYERGVQRLTKACGTGSLSCASLYKEKGRVFVETYGGQLQIDIFDKDVQLRGPAHFPKL